MPLARRESKYDPRQIHRCSWTKMAQCDDAGLEGLQTPLYGNAQKHTWPTRERLALGSRMLLFMLVFVNLGFEGFLSLTPINGVRDGHPATAFRAFGHGGKTTQEDVWCAGAGICD